MNKIRTLVIKEMRDILRDKKTLTMMVVVPILLYPLILIGMTLVISSMMESETDAVHTAGYPAAYAELGGELNRLYGEWLEEQEDKKPALEFVPAKTDEESDVRAESDVWLDIEELEDGTKQVTIRYTSTDQGADYTQSLVEKLLGRYREELLEEGLEKQGLDESFLHPITVVSDDQATLSESMGMSIGGSIGMMLIVTILLGAVYPAIDATAGERERGTLETLLTLPVTNFQMIMSKFLSVSVFACTTAVISLISLGGSVLFLMYGVSDGMAGSLPGISLSAVVTMLPILLVTMIVTALFATALCMCFCVFARSFKEANNYITPLMLIVMFASMVGMVPSVNLDYRTAMIPVVNVTLLVKQLISGQFDVLLAGVTILVNLSCSILIVWVLAKLYNSEEILFSDGFRSFRLFQKRSDIRPGTIPAAGDVLVAVTALFLLAVYVGSAAAVRLGFWGTAVNQLLILFVPLAVTWYMKSDRRTLFMLKKPRVSAAVQGVLLYLGTYCLMIALSGFLTRCLPDSAKNLEVTFSAILEQPLWALILVIAVMPAVGEELLFRGFVFGSLRERLGKKWAILISAVIFGIFHMSLVKLIPTAMLGAAFAWIAADAGSIFVTMALHFINNLFSVLVMKYPEQVSKALPFLVEEKLTLSTILLLAGVGLGLIAVYELLRRTGKKKHI